MLFSIAVIYAFREIFKDDIRNAMWRRLQRGRPKWSRLLRDTTSGQVIGKQLVWLDFMRKQDLPAAVDSILKSRHRQNKVDAEILHYGVSTRAFKEGFLAGYDILQEQVSFSLVPFARYLERGKAKVYQEKDSKVSYESVERRYQVNVVIAVRKGRTAAKYARYKIIMNRSNIVEITRSGVPDDIPALDYPPVAASLNPGSLSAERVAAEDSDKEKVAPMIDHPQP